MDKGVGHVYPAKLAFTLNNALLRLFQPVDKVIEALGIEPDDVVIDFGCGPGLYTVPLARKAKRVIGIDVQAGMLEKATSYAERSDVKEFYLSDGRGIPLPDSTADLVFMRWVYHELEDRQAVLREMTRILKPDGRLAIMEKTRRGFRPIGPPTVSASRIADSIGDVGLSAGGEIQIGNESIVIGKRSSN